MTDTTAHTTTDPAVTTVGAMGPAAVAGRDPSPADHGNGANRTPSSGPDPGVSDSDEQPAGGRVRVTWRHALAAGVMCFAVWLVLDAPTLMHSAQDAPLGTRRTVAMTVLRPIADISRALGLGHVVTGTDRAIGRTGNSGSGVLQVEGVPAPRHRTVPSSVPPPPSPGPTGGAGPAPGTGPGPVLTTPVTAPDGLAPLAVPTPAAPLRLLVVGDSLGIDFGQPLVNDLAATDVVSAVLDGHIDTGLSRPDYFDWQTELQHDITRFQPAAIVVFIGANDPQNFMDGSTSLTYGTAAWNAAYAEARGRLHADRRGVGGPGAVDRDAPHGRPRPQRPDGEPQRHRPEPGGVAPWRDVLRIVAGALQRPGPLSARSCPMPRAPRSRCASSTAPTWRHPVPSASRKPPSPSWATSGVSSCSHQVRVGAAPRQGGITGDRRPQPAAHRARHAPGDRRGRLARPRAAPRRAHAASRALVAGPPRPAHRRARRGRARGARRARGRGGLYSAGPSDVIDMLRLVDDDAPSVMVVGHNPTVHELVFDLLDVDDQSARSRLEQGFAPASLAVVAVPAPSWARLGTGSGTLLELRPPGM